jgi:hypothetical protein
VWRLVVGAAVALLLLRPAPRSPVPHSWVTLFPGDWTFPPDEYAALGKQADRLLAIASEYGVPARWLLEIEKAGVSATAAAPVLGGKMRAMMASGLVGEAVELKGKAFAALKE